MKRGKLGIVFWISASFLVLLVLGAIFGPMFLPEYTDDVGPALQFTGPGYPLGTDDLGRDMLTRLTYGARVSLLIGVSVQAVAVVIGLTVGILGVYAPRWISVPLMRFTDGMFAFPDILLAILIIGVFGFGIQPLIIALSVTAWPAMARLVRTQVSTLKDREYVAASAALGAPTWYIVIKHVLPHLWGIVLAVSMVDIAAVILAESSLSFLGIGVQAPEPSWGSMIDNARAYMITKPYLLIWPCLVLSMTIFALNFVGDGLRALVDPKTR